MKKIFIIIISLSLISIAEVSARVGFNAGYKYFYYIDSQGGQRKPLEGFYIGGNYDIKLFSLFSIEPGLNYNFGSRSDGVIELLGYSAKKSTQEHLIEAPVRLKLTIPINKNFGFLVYGGATFSYSLSGEISYEFSRKSKDEPLMSYKYDYYRGKMNVENIKQAMMLSISQNIDKNEYKNYDLLLGAGAGVIISKKFIVQAGYDQGFINRFAHLKTDSQYRNSFYFGASYIF